MREVVTADEMKALDYNTIQKAGLPSLVLMERAALKTGDHAAAKGQGKRKNPCSLRNRQ